MKLGIGAAGPNVFSVATERRKRILRRIGLAGRGIQTWSRNQKNHGARIGERVLVAFATIADWHRRARGCRSLLRGLRTIRSGCVSGKDRLLERTQKLDAHRVQDPAGALDGYPVVLVALVSRNLRFMHAEP